MKYYLLLMILGLTACSEETEKTSGSPKSIVGIKDVRSIMVQEQGWITTFFSNGADYGMADADTQLTFYDDGRVLLIEYSVGPTHYSGTYRTDEDGVITLDLKDCPAEWSRMVIRSNAGKVCLFRFDGVAETSKGPPYWPFELEAVSWPEPESYEEEDDREYGPLPPLLPPREEEIEQDAPVKP